MLCNIKYWVWDFANVWNNTYDTLNEWVTINNKLPSKTSENLIEKSLGAWCATQRTNQRLKKLSEDKIYLLNKIPCWKCSYNDIWHGNYGKIEQWIKINNKIPSSGSKELEEKLLGSWCSTQRRNAVDGKLAPNKIKLLSKLPNWYWSDKKI